MKKKYYCKEEGCNNKIHITTALYGKGRCQSCAQKKRIKEKGHPSYKGDKALKRQTYFCKEENCNNEICYDNHRIGKGRCASCSHKGEFAFKYKDGRSIKKHYCIDCEKLLSNYKAERCGSCSSKKRIKENGNPMFGKPAPYTKRIYYKGICMRSTWETKFAQFLSLSGIKWEYESERFYFEDCTYLPDFYLPETNEYIEIKGWWRDEDKKRFDLFKKTYSNKNIKVLMKPELEELGIIF